MTTHQLPLRHPSAGREARSRPVSTRRRLRPWTLFVVVVVGAFFGLTYSRTSLDRSAFELDTLEAQIADQQARHFDLRVQAAELRDPRRIADEAAELGMVYPNQTARLIVDRLPEPDIGAEERWAQLKGLLSAQPRGGRP